MDASDPAAARQGQSASLSWDWRETHTPRTGMANPRAASCVAGPDLSAGGRVASEPFPRDREEAADGAS